ncbi:hypothetical protein F3Y22_tig00110332pilonHSYRG00085 [Hibiscus syriacus]|uniref:Uncharacterized protein n=1 Tax=Hibiscus syriacus TaxID=106335 RepID=A0A6A3AVG5_HIBSY|nr:hypothetical protein F3Y22_tig00110332pilonHSYRG00085 [Hibiscus syriacus]
MFSRSNSTGMLFPLIFNKLNVTPNEPFAPSFQALFSTNIVGEKPILVRDFVHSALYDPKHGYFSQRSGAVGVLERSIKFNQLEGRKAYMKHLDKIYKQSGIACNIIFCGVTLPPFLLMRKL